MKLESRFEVKIQPFIHSVNMSTCYVPSIVLRNGEIGVWELDTDGVWNLLVESGYSEDMLSL